MNPVFAILKDNPLFTGIALGDFQRMMTCLSAKTSSFAKDEILLLTGDAVSSVGLILRGGVRILKEDREGRATILTELSAGEIFGEVFACAGIVLSPVTIQATEATEILAIDYRRIISSCGSACPFHTQLIANMLKLIAMKTLMLNQKLEILSKRSTREKLLAYFDLQRGATSRFSIPFNREELANYLCVDRSAMSAELGRMRDEGLIRYTRNEFELLKG